MRIMARHSAGPRARAARERSGQERASRGMADFDEALTAFAA